MQNESEAPDEFNGSDVVTTLFGIECMRVLAQAEIVDEWWFRIETTTELVGCAACGSRAVGHGRRNVRVRVLPVFGRPVVLIWSKRLWRYPDPDCERDTWTVVGARGEKLAVTLRVWAAVGCSGILFSFG